MKYKLNCSGVAVKATWKRVTRIYRHDFRTYGLDVYYYHTEYCANIIKEVIKYIDEHSNDTVKQTLFGYIPNNSEYLGLLFEYRISQLYWVKDEDYQGQGEQARKLIDEFETI